jgi:hypothetical protein
VTAYYFAARYSRHPELREYRAQLLTRLPGATVTSRWLDCHDGTLEESLTPAALTEDPVRGWCFAATDLEDLAAADTLVSFTGQGGKGGRHIEHGYAMARGVRIVIVGSRENVFHCAPDAEVYPSWPEFLDHETGMPRAPGLVSIPAPQHYDPVTEVHSVLGIPVAYSLHHCYRVFGRHVSPHRGCMLR